MSPPVGFPLKSAPPLTDLYRTTSAFRPQIDRGRGIARGEAAKSGAALAFMATLVPSFSAPRLTALYRTTSAFRPRMGICLHGDPGNVHARAKEPNNADCLPFVSASSTFFPRSRVFSGPEGTSRVTHNLNLMTFAWVGPHAQRTVH